ncbi:copper amine oxidase N-terminal domain-containing protein [Lachnospiraceae bacterium NSJ-143]|nr:copper amine oxidase N-terminal domain-containing protein [Lachnospiraceae bacterium NSJ-143]
MKGVLLAATACVCAGMALNAYASEGISLKLNGEKWEMEGEIENRDGRIMIPVNEVERIIGRKTGDSADKNECLIIYGDRHINFEVGNREAMYYYYVPERDESEVVHTVLSVAPELKDGNIMIPLRDTVEGIMEREVEWNGEERSINIKLPVNEDVISAEDYEKIKDKPIKSLDIWYGYDPQYNEDSRSFTLKNTKNIKKAVQAARVMSCITQESGSRGVSYNVRYNIEYEDGQKAEILFNGLDYFEDIESMYFITEEALLQTGN